MTDRLLSGLFQRFRSKLLRGLGDNERAAPDYSGVARIFALNGSAVSISADLYPICRDASRVLLGLNGGDVDDHGRVGIDDLDLLDEQFEEFLGIFGAGGPEVAFWGFL